jgi:hypothetical protein
LFQNYLFFISWANDWKDEVMNLQAQCRGETFGQIKADENKAMEGEEDSSDDEEDDEDSRDEE